MRTIVTIIYKNIAYIIQIQKGAVIGKQSNINP